MDSKTLILLHDPNKALMNNFQSVPYNPQNLLCQSVVECLTQDRGAGGSSLTGVTASWSLSKTHLS